MLRPGQACAAALTDSPENGATCRLWFNLGIIAFLVNMVIFCYLAFWLPYVEVRPAAIPPASTARTRRTRPGPLRQLQADNQTISSKLCHLGRSVTDWVGRPCRKLTRNGKTTARG